MQIRTLLKTKTHLGRNLCSHGFLLLFCFATVALGSGNLIDRNFERATKAKVSQKMDAPLADDLTFLRRLWLDATGTLPAQSEVEWFLAQTDVGKRRLAIDRALNSEAYNHRWTFYLEEMFKSQAVLETGAPIRNAFHNMLYDMISADMSWAEITKQLIANQGLTASHGANFMTEYTSTIGSETRLDALDDYVGSLTSSFLGVQTNCISCHDGAGHLESVNVDLSKRKRRDFWGMAAFLASSALYHDQPYNENTEYFNILNQLQWVSTDDPDFNAGRGVILVEPRAFNHGEYVAESEPNEGARPPRNGGLVEPTYMFTGERPAPGETRREALARFIVKDRQFARNMVNRLWTHYFGTGFIDTVDGFDLARIDAQTAAANNTTVQPKVAGLMEAVVDYFIYSGYQLKPVMKMILESKLYQLDYASLPANNELWPYWGGKNRVRRLEAQAITDAIYRVAGLEQRHVVTGMLESAKSSTWQMPDSFEPNPGAIFDRNTDRPLVDPRVYGYYDLDHYRGMQYATMDLLSSLGSSDRERTTDPNNESSIQLGLTMFNQ